MALLGQVPLTAFVRRSARHVSGSFPNTAIARSRWCSASVPAKAPLGYTDTHTWVQSSDDGHLIGISHFAQGMLGEVWSLDLPKVGAKFVQDEKVASIDGMQIPPEKANASDDESDAWEYDVPEEVLQRYQGRGWDVRMIQIRMLGNMHHIQREVFAPADCVILEVNNMRDRELVNTAAETEGWLLKVKFTEDLPELMSPSEYEKHCEMEMKLPLPEEE
mmetsp:Transcript_15976/g.34584  ORF Transcript_15976/g.34584 Transcript_15976/m.34584 type:complete len:219 (+) Transcript_15976:119-775(+)